VNARTIGLTLTLGRAAIGAGLLLAPTPINTAWIGPDAARPGSRVLGRSLGARDLAIGLGGAAALRRNTGARPWLVAGMLADAADLAATLGSRDVVPRSGLVGVSALAGGAALAGAWLARAVD
jgi:hypothetical protein